MSLLGIICAMDSELAPILRNMEIQTTTKKAGMTFTKGTLHGQRIVAVVSGIGKVNAAVCTEILIEVFGCTHILNVGVAGGLKEDIYPLDVVAGIDLIQHDVDATAFGERLGQIPNLDTLAFPADEAMLALIDDAAQQNGVGLRKGRIVSGDQFIADIGKSLNLVKDFDALACEMEGAAIAQVCYLNQTPFIVLRSISDNANNGATMDYEDFKVSASETIWKVLDRFIQLFKTQAN